MDGNIRPIPRLCCHFCGTLAAVKIKKKYLFLKLKRISGKKVLDKCAKL
jgi:hypothetical protein